MNSNISSKVLARSATNSTTNSATSSNPSVRQRLLRSIAGLAGLVWFGFVATVAVRQREILFNPVCDTPAQSPSLAPLTHRSRSVVLRADDGTRLCGWLCTPRSPGPHPAAIYLGGRAEDVAWVARDAHRMFPGMAVLAMNYRGYGRSHGRPAEHLLVQDAHRVHAWLRDGGAHVDPQRIAIVGRSLGSSIALQVAARSVVKALVLLTPFDSVLSMVKRRLPAMPVGLVLRDRFESTRFAPRVRAPILVLRAESDDIVPAPHTDALVSTLAHLIADEVVPASTHADIPFLASTQKRIACFLQERLQACVRSSTSATPVTPANVMALHTNASEQEMRAASQRSCQELESRSSASRSR